ncbi:hypothetical protein DYI23_13860 [Roseibium polysiphoniae]|uniref:Uncharacterized protein n=1 Tax=Roseibium polysiphoniae TaxID=2571221 RepID=A0A944CER2_9HYPH|nr:hypothetical protein [Roseibium polysiphoniae]
MVFDKLNERINVLVTKIAHSQGMSAARADRSENGILTSPPPITQPQSLIERGRVFRAGTRKLDPRVHA